MWFVWSGLPQIEPHLVFEVQEAQTLMGSQKKQGQEKKTGRPPKFPEHLRLFAQECAAKTHFTLARIAEGLGVSPQLLQQWVKNVKVPHRHRGQGNLPPDPVVALQARNDELEKENKVMRAKLAALGQPVTNTKELIVEVKSGIYRALAVAEARLGDLAATLRALVALDQREADVATDGHPVMLHYYPDEQETYAGPPEDEDKDKDEGGVSRAH